MAVLVDVICSKCNERQLDKWSTVIDTAHGCGGNWERWWTLTRGPEPNTHISERVVVYESQLENNVQYPGNNILPIPERLKRRGYEKVELNVRDLASFERKHNVMNERRHYDRNGRGYEDR